MTTWSVVLAALARFRELHGHVHVPECWAAAHTLDVHAYMLPTPQLRAALSLGVVCDVPVWADIFDMFKIYCKRYGAADVPINYVIRASRKRKADESTPPWAANYDGLPLGEIAMRVWLVYIQLPSHRLNELKSVRFAFNTHASWATVVGAKAVFASINGHNSIPDCYAVPPDDTAWPPKLRGLRLGHYLRLQATANGVNAPPTTRVIDTFVDARVQETEFDRHVLGLKIYKRGSKSPVAHDFVVPGNDARWPRRIWGLRLGDFAATLRRDYASLSALQRATVNDIIGFEWDPVVAKCWSDIVATLTQWHATHRDCGWPDAFEFTAEWPTSVVGETLGYILTLLEVHEDFATAAHRHTLRRLCLNVDNRWTTKVAALTTFYSLHGHLRVPRDYVVPTTGEWPPAATGMPLGFIVSLLRRVPPAVITYVQRRELEALAFEWDLATESTLEATRPPSVAAVDVAPAKTVAVAADEVEAPHVIDDTAQVSINWAMWAVALTQFKAHEGHVDIPRDYIVGADDARWPVALRSFPVGPILTKIRSHVVVPPPWVQSQVQIVGVDLFGGDAPDSSSSNP
ncbi:hypothetical protein SPRG_18091 [Saprolegnia parasitica CBS 223.65]|uniref:Helicase-associated domain-containing protein n=1 Tax=Saprolegnia parasitica (strain CBS 223.65) TaxID=695850 RepID=A0A067BI19_SAPPC|nr:hypothetical protein SPRG_18091 [Saprolegnia parasitica CBS 223.65]KDO16380.1 hypothetical protein SPRG_18091 [Saprolegnia parasitica CBS 223.65]|eukprot:XP_012212911.1 hypothetical protein SPRG_18091 [Saprolegnia parasitica CBS 223.65]